MELISREELRDKMFHEAFEVDSELQKWDSGCWIRYKLFEKILDEVPIIEIRPKGEWETVSREKGACELFFTNKKCSNCGYEYCFPFYYNYCPECGADMREEK